MAIQKILTPPTAFDLKELTGEFPTYIKLTADVESGILYGGARLHADMEKILLENGSLQSNIWGGGVDLKKGIIDFNAIANIRPNQNNSSTEILDPEIRKKFYGIVKIYFPRFN